MGNALSRLGQWVYPGLGNSHPLLRQIPPYIVRLNDIDGGDIVISTNHSVIRRGVLHPSRRTIAVKTCKQWDATAVKVKVKVLRNTLWLTGPQHALDEIRIWVQLEHESIMPLMGITTKFDHTVSMVTEWMERGNAHKYVKDEAVDPRPLLLDVARGLNYLHGLGIVHGDIKGLNVLISKEGRALITDFGSSYQSNPQPSMDIDPPRGGSLRWMAPESLDTCTVSRQADVWAYGMTALELFTRTYPYQGALTELGIMSRISRGPPSRPSDESTNFRLCDKWWSVCTRCWILEPSARPAMNDIVAQIEGQNESGA